MARAKPKPKKIYFIGIKGMGMSALAVITRQLGFEVWGSDMAETYSSEETEQRFRDLDITTYQGFEAQHLQAVRPDKVVVSAAYGATNPEVKAAKALRVTLVTQSEMLGEVIAKQESIGVAGIHGKTTTTAMLAFVLEQAGYSPSYFIGAPDVAGLKGNGHLGDGKYFVVEADEYRKSETDNTPKFLDLPLNHLIITSLELDHPDIFDTAEDVYAAFYRLWTRLPRGGTAVINTDWQLTRRLVNRLADRPALTYGLSSPAQFQIVEVQERVNETEFQLRSGEKTLGPFTVNLPGLHNVQNATAVIILALQLGVSLATLTKTLPKITLPKRRFQILGQVNGATVVDDYAHHPTAIRYLIAAARKRFPGKNIMIVFQPHTYSRTGKFLSEFALALAEADRVILLNIFASAREKSGYVSIKDLIDRLREHKDQVEYRPTLSEVATYLKSQITDKDVVLLTGAGDVYKVFAYLQNT